MAITVYGVESNVGVTEWSLESSAQSQTAPHKAGVLSGFVVSVATGTRLLSVSTNGLAYVPGARVVSDAAETVTLDANSSGNPRIDVIVLEVDWTGTAATAGDVKFVKGTAAASPVAPSLTQTEGVLWQIPLAYVTVANGATQLAGGNVADAYSQVDTGYIALSLGAGYAQASPALSVRRRNGMVEFDGEFTKSSGAALAVGSSVTLTSIPAVFQPARPGPAYAATRGAAPVMVALQVTGSGDVTFYPITGSVANGDTVRVHATWLSEV